MEFVRGDKTEVKLTQIGLPAGTYYVYVDDNYYQDDATYSVTAGWRASSVWETEWNETRPTADKISVNKKYYGNISDYGDEDFFKFTTTKSGTVTIKFRHDYIASESDYWYVELQNAEGDQITSADVRGDKTEVKLTQIGLPAGTYYVYVDDNYYQDDATYSVTAEWRASSVWETEWNESRPTADKISVNKKYYGNISDYGDEDFFKFTTTKSGTVTIKFRHDYVASESDYWYVELQNAEGDQITSVSVPGDKTEVKLSQIGLPAGTYYVYVDDSYYQDDATYSITAIVPATSAPSNVYVNLYGHNDIKVSWSKVSGASGYYVYYRKVNKSGWVSLGRTTNTYMRKANLADGVKYQFRVIPYKKTADGRYSGLSKDSVNIYTLKAPDKPIVKKYSQSYAKVSWTDIYGESGYQVYKMKLQNGKYVKVASLKTTISSTTKFKAPKGVKYYYKVRAYKKVGSNVIYGPWSGVTKYTRT